MFGGPSVITGVLIREGGRQAGQSTDTRSRRQNEALASWKEATSHGIQAALKLRETRKWMALQTSKRNKALLTPDFKNFPQFVVIHTVKSFDIVNKAEVDVFSGTLAFSMIQQMLAI